MKKLLMVIFTTILLTGSSCSNNSGNVSLTYSENETYYFMEAHFDKKQNRNVEEYMNEEVGKRSNMSFTNTRIDATVTLDDHTIFYIKKTPSFLEIKLDKNKNSPEGYHEIKSMCEGLKRVLKN